jgi:hypothetical protein
LKYAIEPNPAILRAQNIHDVSRGGLAFYTEREIKKGAILKIYFLPPNRRSPVEARGSVVRCLEVIKGSKVFDIGIQFLDVSDEAMLALEELEEHFIKRQQKARAS